MRATPLAAGLATALLTVALVACGGGDSGSGSSGVPEVPKSKAGDQELVAGRDLYASFCAECHGNRGQGLVGPKLADGAVAKAFPTIEEQITLIENGKGVMPAWKGRLTPEQIRSVARYEREVL